MVKFLINRPIGVIMTFLALILLGIYSSNLLPISLLPEIKIPEVTIRISYPDKSASEIEKSLTLPLRMQLMQVSGIKDIESETRDGDATIKLVFDYGVDIDMLFIEVNEKVDIAMAEMPRDIPRPRIIKASVTDLPVFIVNLSFATVKKPTPEKMLEMSQLANKVIRKRFEQLPEVALADITGITHPELLIIPNQGKLIALGVTHEQISMAIKNSMMGRGSIRYREGQLVFDLLIEQKVFNPSDLENIPISSGGRIFKIKEIAEVKLKPANVQGSYQINGNQAICMPIIKSTNARMSDLKSSISALINQLSIEYKDIAFTISNDQTQVLDFTLGNLKNSLIGGVILAVSVMFLFLGDFRSPILMSITIPVSLLGSMVFFYLSGLTLNIVSISGLILGVGMMIDNSIIVIDNITQWRNRGNALEFSVINGTNEVVTPLLSSMLTTCAVFIPLIFLSGIAGAMFFDQAIAITIGLGVSFWVSITLMPTLYYGLHRKSSQVWIDRKAIIPLDKSYKLGYNYVFNHWKQFFMVVIFLLICFPFLFNAMEKRQMPELTRDEILVNLAWGENISLEENETRCQRLLKLQKDNISFSAFYLGRQQLILSRGLEMDESDASLYFKGIKNNDIIAFSRRIDNFLKKEYPETIVSYSFPESAFDRVFPESKADLIAKIASAGSGTLPSQKQLDSLINVIRTKYPNITMKTVPSSSQIQLKFNEEMMLLYQVPLASIQSQLEIAFQKNRIGNLAFEQQAIPIILGENYQKIDDIVSKTLVKSNIGPEIPLRNFVKPYITSTYRSIYGDNSSIFIPITFNGDSKTLKILQRDLVDYDKSNRSTSITFSGKLISSKNMTWELLSVLLVSILLLYFILAAQFESIWQPLIVLIELPIDIGSALLILWITGGSINLMSLIGIVVMGGIVVNDSILKIDTINRIRKEGGNIIDAISEGGERRLKAIIMTSLTTILALIPILFGKDIGSELQQPMAITLITGMIIGTLVSLYIIPLIYWFVYKNK